MRRPSSARAAHGPLQPRLFMLMDEAANIAPVRNLASWLSQCGDHGIVIATIWQSIAQIDQRYGRAARDAICAASTAQMFIPPLAEPTSAGYLSELLGEEPVANASGGGSHETLAVDPRRRPGRRRGCGRSARGRAILIYRDLPPAIVRAPGWFEDPRFAAARSPASDAAPRARCRKSVGRRARSRTEHDDERHDSRHAQRAPTASRASGPAGRLVRRRPRRAARGARPRRPCAAPGCARASTARSDASPDEIGLVVAQEPAAGSELARNGDGHPVRGGARATPADEPARRRRSRSRVRTRPAARRSSPATSRRRAAGDARPAGAQDAPAGSRQPRARSRRGGAAGARRRAAQPASDRDPHRRAAERQTRRGRDRRARDGQRARSRWAGSRRDCRTCSARDGRRTRPPWRRVYPRRPIGLDARGARGGHGGTSRARADLAACCCIWLGVARRALHGADDAGRPARPPAERRGTHRRGRRAPATGPAIAARERARASRAPRLATTGAAPPPVRPAGSRATRAASAAARRRQRAAEPAAPPARRAGGGPFSP